MPVGEKPRILFVDDKLIVRTCVQLGLRELFGNSVDVHVASGEASAKRVLEENGPFHVVISDLNMERKDSGIRLLEHVREHYPHAVRVLTTSEDPSLGHFQAVAKKTASLVHVPLQAKVLFYEAPHARVVFDELAKHAPVLKRALART